jgi:3,4-dihydroxy-9,10-secoandrosta-1,3,5(10)-triene-9,17-dione 4,5-dioxygenase
MSVRALGYLILETEKPLRDWKTFASDLLGAMVVDRGDELFVRIDDRNFRLCIRQGGSQTGRIGWDAGDHESLHALRDKLESSGLATRPGSKEECRERGVLELVHATDPGGVPLELFVGQMYIKEPFVSPHGARFITGELGLGHVLMRTARYDQTVEFYRSLLGFRITDVWTGEGITAAFMRCNARHHSIAVSKLPSEGPNRIGHVMLEVDNIDLVGLALDRGRDVVTRTMGRHFNDEMISGYLRTPSGCDVEYGTAGRRIDDASWVVGQIDAPSGWGHDVVVPR